MASVTKRGKTWSYSVSRYTNGKYDPIRKGGFATKKEASIAAMEVEMRLQKGAKVITGDTPFVEYFENWIDKYKKSCHKNTYRRYKDSLNRAKEHFKDKPMKKITPEDYQEFLDEYAAEHSKESVRKLHTQIKACVTDALDEGYVPINFTRKGQNKGAIPAKKASEKFIHYKESKILYEYLISHAKHKSDFLILFDLVSGLRFGELVGLTESAFDFENNTIYVYQAWDYREGSGFTDLKNTSSERTIPIDPVVMQMIKQFIDKNKQENEIIFSNKEENGLIFKSNGKIKVVSNNAANKQLRSILKKLGIKEIGCHGLRHTHASVLLYEGFSLQYVSERLGHESTYTTQKTYAHILKELRAKEDYNISRLYKQKEEEKNEDNV